MSVADSVWQRDSQWWKAVDYASNSSRELAGQVLTDCGISSPQIPYFGLDIAIILRPPHRSLLKDTASIPRLIGQERYTAFLGLLSTYDSYSSSPLVRQEKSG